MPFNVVLVAPEIPHNTGNIIRLCANAGARLHLVKPLGFELTKKALRRAALDYQHLVDVTIHETIDSLINIVDIERTFVTTSGGEARYDQMAYKDGDTVIFGSESVGLPVDLLERFPDERTLGIPMMSANRSINIANAVSIVVYEMWRQQSFLGASVQPRQYYS